MQINQRKYIRGDLPAAIHISWHWDYYDETIPDPGARYYPINPAKDPNTPGAWTQTFDIFGIPEPAKNELTASGIIYPLTSTFSEHASYGLSCSLRLGNWAFTSDELDRFPWSASLIAAAKANGNGYSLSRTELQYTYGEVSESEYAAIPYPYNTHSLTLEQEDENANIIYRHFGMTDVSEVTNVYGEPQISVSVLGGKYKYPDGDGIGYPRDYDFDVIVVGAESFVGNVGYNAFDATTLTRRMVEAAPNYDFFIELITPPVGGGIDYTGLDQKGLWKKLYDAACGWQGTGWTWVRTSLPGDTPEVGIWMCNATIANRTWQWTPAGLTDWHAAVDLSSAGLAATDRIHYGMPAPQSPIPAN
jgi:hypothetical protein